MCSPTSLNGNDNVGNLYEPTSAYVHVNVGVLTKVGQVKLEVGYLPSSCPRADHVTFIGAVFFLDIDDFHLFRSLDIFREYTEEY